MGLAEENQTKDAYEMDFDKLSYRIAKPDSAIQKSFELRFVQKTIRR